MPAKKKEKPASLYSQYYEPEKKVVVRPPLFVRVTKRLSRMFPSLGKGAKFDARQEEAFGFLGYDVSAEEFYAAYKAIFFFGLMLGSMLAALLYYATTNKLVPLDQNLFFLFAGVLVLGPVVASFLYLKRPYAEVENEKIRALAYVPEIVNYLTMSMRLTPNLEKAVEFAASHGKGKIAEDFKKMVWDVQIGRFSSVEEALDELAYRWGDYNDDFKHALMLIRASVLEPDVQRRELILEKASADVLEGSREKMDFYARKLQQPTVYLYYFGILLPLLLAILLPIGGSIANIDIAKTEYLLVAYNIFIPLLVFAFGLNIVAGKPPTNAPPDVSESFPGLPPAGRVKILGLNLPFKLFAVLTIVLFLYAGQWIDNGYGVDTINGGIIGFNERVLIPLNSFIQERTKVDLGWGGGVLPDGIPLKGTLADVPSYSVQPEQRKEAILANLKDLDSKEPVEGRNEVLAGEVQAIPHLKLFSQTMLFGAYHFVGQFTIFGFLLGVALALSFYWTSKYAARKKIQDEIRAMETEFKDALYVLASRMGENKPIEEALRSSVQFLPKSKLAKDVFRKILENITTLGMTLDAAIFDNTFGALKNIPSDTIRGGMQFLVDSVELGVSVASKSLIALSLQLRNTQKIDESLKKLLQDVTSILATISAFVAPIVLGVVSSMQKIILSSLANTAGASGLEQGASNAISGSSSFAPSFSSLSNMFQSTALQNTAETSAFTLILGIYVIEITFLLTYFNAQIEDTNNKLHAYTTIAKTLPIAVALYCLTVYITSTMFFK